MKRVTIKEAKATLSSLIERACHGEEIIIAQGTRPAVRLVPTARRRRERRKLGILRGKLVVGPEFFAPLSQKELEDWE